MFARSKTCFISIPSADLTDPDIFIDIGCTDVDPDSLTKQEFE